jgi:integrase
LAANVLLRVATDVDPQVEGKAQRSAGTFDQLQARYLKEYAKRRNRSWQQADKLVRRNLLPHWGKLPAASIARVDVKAAMARMASPSVANQTLAAASAIFTWALKEEVGGVTVNPCVRVERHTLPSRERILSDSEIPQFWSAFDDGGLIASSALKMILLLGQRPGEVIHMRREHIIDGWWCMPGAPVAELKWPGTKNGESHRVWLPAAAQRLLTDMNETGFVFSAGAALPKLDTVMRAICATLSIAKVTPRDFRRTHGTMITSLGFGRDSLNRIQNHREGGIASVYDRHQYADENKKIMETVAAKIMALVNGDIAGNVLKFNKTKENI